MGGRSLTWGGGGGHPYEFDRVMGKWLIPLYFSLYQRARIHGARRTGRRKIFLWCRFSRLHAFLETCVSVRFIFY